eukprot:TRINITY_DN29641_c0_g1_i1.p1 TRINITY_DN29641_c0_g1~~TRINITY_DN29641_c0_g1_i1.p1  ORF type:complete len:782 (+),score=128.57 TRINITY_DN29641_c0_g1_i1:174-2348(+)
MGVLESLDAYLHEEAKFVLGVDFAGSTSSVHCSSRVHYVTEKGEMILGAGDFDKSFGHAKLKKDGTASSTGYAAFDGDSRQVGALSAALDEKKPENGIGARMQHFAIANSYWFTFWRGQVAGVLLSALISCKEKECGQDDREELERSDGDGLAIAQRTYKKKDRHGDIEEGKDDKSVKVVIAVSIDGGPITQVEKEHIPGICRDTVANIRRRGYAWGDGAWVLWCHFPTLRDMLESLDGVDNLVHDHSFEPIARDDCGKPTNFKFAAASSESLKALDKAKSKHQEEACGARPSLLRATVDNIIKNADDCSVARLMQAAFRDDCETVRFILNKNGDVNEVFKPEESDFAKKEFEEDYGHSGASRDGLGRTAIMCAAERNNLAVARLLIESKANVNAKISCDFVLGEKGFTALGFAVREGHADMVQLLYDNKADPNAKISDDGMIPLYIAMHEHLKGRSRLATIEALVKMKVDVTEAMEGLEEMFLTPPSMDLDSWKQERSLSSVLNLLMKNTAVVSNTKYNDTMRLVRAAALGDCTNVKALLEKKMDVNAVGKSDDDSYGNGMFALACAAEKGQEDIVRMLVDAGADVNKKLGDDTTTSFTIATLKGHIGIMTLLHKAGAKVDVLESEMLDMILEFTVEGRYGPEVIECLMMDCSANLSSWKSQAIKTLKKHMEKEVVKKVRYESLEMSAAGHKVSGELLGLIEKGSRVVSGLRNAVHGNRKGSK